MSEVKLLPCPWCGEKLASVSVSEGSTFRWRKVDGCCADGPEVRHNTMADDQEAAEVESRTAAIAAWNTRANLAERDAEVEALRDRLRVAQQQVIDALALVESDRVIQRANDVLVAESEARAERLAGALRVAVESDLGALWIWPESAREQWMKDALAALAQESNNAG